MRYLFEHKFSIFDGVFMVMAGIAFHDNETFAGCTLVIVGLFLSVMIEGMLRGRK
jgi:hypothetical protein